MHSLSLSDQLAVGIHFCSYDYGAEVASVKSFVDKIPSLLPFPEFMYCCQNFNFLPRCMVCTYRPSLHTLTQPTSDPPHYCLTFHHIWRCQIDERPTVRFEMNMTRSLGGRVTRSVWLPAEDPCHIFLGFCFQWFWRKVGKTYQTLHIKQIIFTLPHKKFTRHV